MEELGVARHHREGQLPLLSVVFPDEGEHGLSDTYALIVGDGDYAANPEEPRLTDSVSGCDEAYGSTVDEGGVAVRCRV